MQVEAFPPVSLSRGQVSPVYVSPSPEEYLYLVPASCLSPQKFVWSCPLHLWRNLVLPLLLSFQQLYSASPWVASRIPQLAQALLEAPCIGFSEPLLFPGAISNQTLLKVLKHFDNCYGMSYFQLIQEADFEIKEESDPVLLVFLAEAGSLSLVSSLH